MGEMIQCQVKVENNGKGKDNAVIRENLIYFNNNTKYVSELFL